MATAIFFIAEIGDIRCFKSAKQVQKYVGLVLREKISANSYLHKIIRIFFTILSKGIKDDKSKMIQYMKRSLAD